MTTQEAEALGYKIVEASVSEVGLTKNGSGIRTWWYSQFWDTQPTLDHPLVQTAISINEGYDETHH